MITKNWKRMKDSSPKNNFESINLKNVLTLISVINDFDLGMKSIIEERFNQQGTNFDKTASFLEAIGVVKITEKEIRLQSDFGKPDEKIILDAIQRDKNPYRDEILNYLSKFNHIDGVIEYKPPELYRGEFSDVRNFLIEIGVVKYENETDIYIIAPENILLFALAKEKTKPYTPARLKRTLIQQDKVGAAAELAVLDWEKNRIGKDYKDYLEHISVKNEAAGYDIKSITFVEDKIMPRYIEVKAVSADSYKFYWSRNEINVAKLLIENYYLYLLPVFSRMQFAFERIKIISDPVAEIFGTDDTWDVERDGVCCRLK